MPPAARPLSGTYGIQIQSSTSSNNLIGGPAAGAGNLISGNLNGISDSGINTTIQGNLIGTDAPGSKAIPNATGITSINLMVASNTPVGGLTPGARNIISGNTGDGIDIGGKGINAGSALIGGLVPEARNVISGNGTLSGFANLSLGTNSIGSGTTVQGNYIGTDVTGNVALSNPKWGIVVATSNNVIGGTSAAARNLISGNTLGIQFGGITTGAVKTNIVQGNYIGLNQAGSGPLPNSGDGIRLEASSPNLNANNKIGRA